MLHFEHVFFRVEITDSSCDSHGMSPMYPSEKKVMQVMEAALSSRCEMQNPQPNSVKV